MGTFTTSLNDWCAKAKGNVDDAVGRTVVGLAAKIDERSPVGNPTTWKHNATIADNGDLIQHGVPADYVGGRFRGNWQLGIGVVPAGETGRVDPNGEVTQAAIQAAIPEQAAGIYYWLANNVPYAQPLEDGHSRQAPNGMVALAVLDYPGLVAQAATAANK